MSLPHVQASQLSSLHVCPHTGNDNWTGFLPSPDPSRFDGPLKSLVIVLDRVRQLRRQGALGQTVTIWLHGGNYLLTKPLVFSHEDGGILFRSWADETPIISGGRRVTGWQERTLASGLNVFVAEANTFFTKGHPPLSLYVHGQRTQRPRWPREGWSWMEAVPSLDLNQPFELFTSHQQFQFKEGDFNAAWRNVNDIDAIVSHFWVIERMPIAECDAEKRLIKSSRRSLFPLRDAWDSRFAKYYLENVFEGLANPGEFYADRAEGLIYYVPRAGEQADSLEAVIPVARQLIRIEGTGSEPVRGVEFYGITFQHTEVQHPESIFQRCDPMQESGRSPRLHDSSKHFRKQCLETPYDVPFAAFPQAAANTSAAIRIEHARLCVIEHCVIEHTGAYAIQLLEGARQCRIHASTMRDLGAGGVMMDGGDLDAPVSDQNSHHHITHCRIHNAGHVFPAAVGVLSMHSFRNVIAHNEIYDLSYSGISCGWVWGYDQNISRENRIDYNRIHHLGQRGGLSDMGGIYTLGVQPGTRLKGNVIHDIAAANYGAWCIYLDEGSSFITVESNVCLGPASNSFFEHWGRQNIYRYNLFATTSVAVHGAPANSPDAEQLATPEPGGSLLGLSGERDVSKQVDYPEPGATIIHNILLTNGQPLFSDNQCKFQQKDLRCDMNLLWDVTKQSAPSVYFRDDPWKHLLAPGEIGGVKDISLSAAQAQGLETHSTIADPQILEMSPRIFRCATSSPIYLLNIPLPQPERAGPEESP
ncbi:MAG: right-handed parallel beta-helix repeat-containing protein [Blastochloris sp.]|nr:right-handed parallel beta-helix repeat-containing protein [Blastochloris sp.]